MLRILVISLVVANLLLLGFQDSEPETQPEAKTTQSVERDSGIPTIHLFSEMMQDQDLLSGSRQCFSLGPFHSIEDKDETRTRLLAVSTNISERQTEALVEKGYWVFMPPYASSLEANEELLSLQALGLEDIGITYEGEWQNAISLGYFMRHENAQRRKKSLQERGYEPLIRVQRQAESRYWLDYEQQPGSGLVVLDMQNRPNDFMQRSLPCPEEDLFDIAQPETQQAAQATAQLQPAEEEAESVLDQSEDLTTPEGIEIATTEVVETLPDPAGETDSEGSVETTPESGAGIETESELITEPESTIETEPEGEAGSILESAMETDSEVDSGITSEGAIVNVTEGDAGAVLEGAIETGSDGDAGTNSEGAIGTESETEAGTTPQGASGTGPEYTVGSGSDGPAATEQEAVDDTETREG